MLCLRLFKSVFYCNMWSYLCRADDCRLLLISERRRRRQSKAAYFRKSEWRKSRQCRYGRFSQEYIFGLWLFEIVFGRHDGRGKFGSVVRAELMFLEVFARLIEIEKSRRAFIEFFQRSAFKRTNRLVDRRRRRERLETELLVMAGNVEMVLLRVNRRRSWRITDLAGV